MCDDGSRRPLSWLNDVDVKGSGVGCCVGFFCVLLVWGSPRGSNVIYPSLGSNVAVEAG